MGRKKGPSNRRVDAAMAAPAPAAHDAEVARVRALLELMRDHGLVELEIGPDGQSVRMSKSGPATWSLPMAAPPPAPVAMAAASHGPPAAAPAAKPAAPAGEKFLSPMVGTFYRASSPEAKAFVVEGDVVKADSVLCIIEAMKVMNEIKAEMAGKVVQILVENGEAVEFGQPLFVIQAS